MTEAIHIRAYQETDYDILVQLLEYNIPAYFAPEELKDFKQYLKAYRELYFVVEWEGEIVGCGGINFPKQKNRAVISWDFFHPKYQNKGCGTALMDYRKNVIQKIPGIQIISVRTSQHAWKFYQKQGFQLIGITKDFWAKGYDLYNMKMEQY